MELTLVHCDWTFPLAAVWGLMLVAALAGWGKLLGYGLRLPEETKTFPLGLAAACGIAIFIVFSGLLLLLGFFSKWFVALFLVLGLCFLVGSILRERPSIRFTWPKEWSLRILTGLVVLLIILSFAGAVARRDYTGVDDFPAYLTFPKIMLDTGSFIDPFSFRRLSALGGQSALDTLITAFLSWKYTHLLDCGVALLISLALVIEEIRSDTFRANLGRLFLLALVLTFPVPRINLSSELTCSVLVLALLRAFDLTTTKAAVGWRGPLLIGLLSAATATLRSPEIFALALILPGNLIWRIWAEPGQFPSLFKQGLMTFAICVIFLLPWMIVSQLSSGTFLYPIIKGNQQAYYTPFGSHLSAFQLMAFVAGFFLKTPYLLLFLPVALMAPSPARQSALVTGACLLLISAALVSKLPTGSYYDISRYLIPLACGYYFYACAAVTREAVAAKSVEGKTEPSFPVTIVCVIFGLLLTFQTLLFVAKRVGPMTRNIIYACTAESESRTYIASASNTTGNEKPYEVWELKDVRSSEAIGIEYAQGMSKIPAGAKVLVAVDFPFLLNFATHQIYNIDQPGAASINPGLPYFQGAEAVKSYLLGLGVSYIAIGPIDQAGFMHSKPRARAEIYGPVPLFSYVAKYELDFLNNVDDLALSNPIIYESPHLRIISLQGK